ncbi:MAG: UDP-N-acetylmuramoyl-L-alanine--D-glutamate ligase [Candidatus Omnitrophica bacterium]|nr:UDP-N-acetylmuramoyl-L-alanine--D-glutamate ligase [Candidatus Omnitrophota bacterium]
MFFKKVGVIGLGRSGWAATQLLRARGVDVEVSDCSESKDIAEKAEILQEQGIRVELGRHSRGFIQNKNLIVVSPGVHNPLVSLWAKQENIPLISEIELGYYFCHAPIIAISGTNGKTTTATLIESLLKNAAKKVALCGNIGIPFSQIVSENNYEIIVLEVSSFQLEKIDKFKPYISIILNITPDHLDRYKTFEEYRRTKYRIFENQGEGDWVIIGSKLQAPSSKPKNKSPQILYLDEEDGNKQAVRLVGEILKIKKEIVDRTLKEFKGLEHRLEYLGRARGIRFINDSKATNVDSVRYALQKLSPWVILILGGRDKGGDFGALRSLIEKKVKKLLLIGEAREKIKNQLAGVKPIKEANSLEGAFNLACQAAEKGDTVLLSPGCASFDMFANFEQRGKEFRKLVKDVHLTSTPGVEGG